MKTSIRYAREKERERFSRKHTVMTETHNEERKRVKGGIESERERDREKESERERDQEGEIEETPF